MKPINSYSILESFTAWIYDFEKDHGRFPSSLKDLAENRHPRHGYNPGNIQKRHEEHGYNFTYNLDGFYFELTVQHDNEDPCTYTNRHNKK
jgi:hypothetical protein